MKHQKETTASSLKRANGMHKCSMKQQQQQQQQGEQQTDHQNVSRRAH
jgi:hypothetical protein